VAGSNLGLTVRVTSPEGGMVGVPVTLERRSAPSSTWRTVATVPTDVSGRTAFTISGLASTTSWRARVAATSVWKAAEGRASTKVAPRVVAKPSTLTPAPGATVVLKVRLTPKRQYVTVRRQMLVDGAWRTMATQQTNAKGRVTFTFQWPKAPTANTYRVITRKTDGLVAGESLRFSIRTR
jgi:5-hydroxyisourate hydrolase-like protein (transthyretin family)